ncbi:MAG: methylglutamate dehydrogenase [Phycisphaerae bacterium]
MTSVTRTSPLHDRVAALNPRWCVVRGMRMAASLGRDETTARECVAVADLSCLDKAGIKGPEAASWLESLGMPVPQQANTWIETPGGGVIARLGRTEFFIEDAQSGDAASRLRNVLGAGTSGVYPVIRQDAGIVLVGRHVNELLVQTCNVDFQDLGSESRTVVMTMMVGVAVLIIRQDQQSIPGFRIWCDSTYAPYLWDTLTGIAAELGGGPIGTGALLSEAGKLE